MISDALQTPTATTSASRAEAFCLRRAEVGSPPRDSQLTLRSFLQGKKTNYSMEKDCRNTRGAQWMPWLFRLSTGRRASTGTGSKPPKPLDPSPEPGTKPKPPSTTALPNNPSYPLEKRTRKTFQSVEHGMEPAYPRTCFLQSALQGHADSSPIQ